MPTELQEIYEIFISKITDYDLLELTEEDLEQELFMMLKKALPQFIELEGVEIDDILGQFSRELIGLEKNILSSFMVLEWLNPKINNISLLRQSLSSKDFQMYSQANHLKELKDLKADTNRDIQYWINRYTMFNFKKSGGV